MSDQCAREGCGEPLVWHTTNSTISELRESRPDLYANKMINIWQAEGSCLRVGCTCPGYLAPKPAPPQAWVMEFPADFYALLLVPALG